jgi:LasA protease
VTRLVLLLLLPGWLLAAPAAASEVRYTGRALVTDYRGPVLIDNSQYRYTGPDRLSFSSAEHLQKHYPHLLPLRPAIDTWASRLGIHPRVLSAVVNDYFTGLEIRGDQDDFDAVVQVAAALSTAFSQQAPDDLAASRAAMATADALFFELQPPKELAESRSSKAANAPAAPALFGYLQPPWEIGETWAGGGAHGSAHNSLDFWGRWVPWNGDTSPYWVAAMQSGTTRVWSSCGMAIVHPNGWVTDYYHLDNIQVTDRSLVQRNDRIANYADNEAQAICSGGWSSGPHVHMSVSYDGNPVSVDKKNLDFTAFSHNEGIGDYDTDCNRSWYNHYTVGKVCPNFDQLLNDAPSVLPMFTDGFESGNATLWSSTIL